MGLKRTTFAGTHGAAASITTEPLFTAVATSFGTLLYDNTDTVNGQATSLRMTPSGSGIRQTRENGRISTRTLGMQIEFTIPTTGNTTILWAGVASTTRVFSVQYGTANNIQIIDAAGGITQIIPSGLTPGMRIAVDVFMSVHATVAAQGILKCKVRESGSATTLGTPFSSTTYNLGTALLTGFAAIAATTSSTVTAFSTHTVAWDDTATDYIPPWYITAAPGTGPLGKLVHIGDSVSWQDANGAINVPAAYVAAGWLAADIQFIGVPSKTFHLVDNDGKTTVQNIQDARAALGAEEPKVWVIALGTNYRFEDDPTTDTRVALVMNEINSVGSPGRVLIVGISQATANGGLDANSIRRNNRIRTLMATYANLYHTNIDEWIRNGRDETGLWQDPIDANFAHMSPTGYALRNGFVAKQAKKLVSQADVNYTNLQVGASPVKALYVGGLIAWVKS